MDIFLNFLILSGLEIILGIDNVIFIAILVGRLEPKDRPKIRFIGLSLALILRVTFLMIASVVMSMKETLFEINNFPISGRVLILFFGGLFLILKGLSELKELFKSKIDKNQSEKEDTSSYKWRYVKIIAQIIFIDLVLSFDSILVALAMTKEIFVITAAIVLAMIVMLISANKIGDFIESHPSIKVIAITFIMLVGVLLLANSIDIDIPKAYLYFAMLFSMAVELINIALAKKHNIKVR